MDSMIAEIRFKNMFSFRDEAILSFEADRSKDMEALVFQKMSRL